MLQNLSSGDDAMGIAERFLYDSDAGVRQTAIDVGEFTVETLELLEDGPEAEMEAASTALGRLRAESAVEPLFRIAAGKRKPSVSAANLVGPSARPGGLGPGSSRFDGGPITPGWTFRRGP
ncbi:MAG: hypothetical protein IPL30_07945 [Elusimicrobia bacterium]|nr:hypothetical protein [Elusimicrobiota bacterium]